MSVNWGNPRQLTGAIVDAHVDAAATRGNPVALAASVANATLSASGHRTTGEWASQGAQHRTPGEWLSQGNHRTVGEWLSGAPSKNAKK